MPNHLSRIGSLAALSLAGAALALPVAAGASQAHGHAPAGHGHARCGAHAVFQAVDGDAHLYTLVAGGALEHASAWKLAGGAAVVGGNEDVLSGSGSHSLSLPAGSSATTHLRCIGRLYPTFRFFARNAGDPASTLRVDAVYRVRGKLHTVALGSISAGSAWEASPALALGDAGSALRRQVHGQVRVRFTPLGDGGAWQIDDVYVDPYKMK